MYNEEYTCAQMLCERQENKTDNTEIDVHILNEANMRATERGGEREDLALECEVVILGTAQKLTMCGSGEGGFWPYGWALSGLGSVLCIQLDEKNHFLPAFSVDMRQ